MLNYLECNIKDFNAALDKRNENVKELSSEHLYILFTKYDSDYKVAKNSNSKLHNRITKEIARKKEEYKQELLKRGIEINETEIYVLTKETEY